MPTCCGVKSEVANTYPSGTVEYFCPVCKTYYCMAEMGGHLTPPKTRISISVVKKGRA